jgi:hypothetical protein
LHRVAMLFSRPPCPNFPPRVLQARAVVLDQHCQRRSCSIALAEQRVVGRDAVGPKEQDFKPAGSVLVILVLGTLQDLDEAIRGSRYEAIVLRTTVGRQVMQLQ